MVVSAIAWLIILGSCLLGLVFCRLAHLESMGGSVR